MREFRENRRESVQQKRRFQPPFASECPLAVLFCHLPSKARGRAYDKEMQNIFGHVMLSKMDPMFVYQSEHVEPNLTFTFSSRLSRSEV